MPSDLVEFDTYPEGRTFVNPTWVTGLVYIAETLTNIYTLGGEMFQVEHSLDDVRRRLSRGH